MSEPALKLLKIKELLEPKRQRLSSEKANLEWHNVYGPPMAMVCLQLEIVEKVLEIIEN